MSLLPGHASEAEASPWQPSSAHSPASAASTTMTPVPWQGTHHEAAALAQIGPAALQTPFQQGMHRSGSLQVEAAKEVRVSRGRVLSCLECISFQVTSWYILVHWLRVHAQIRRCATSGVSSASCQSSSQAFGMREQVGRFDGGTVEEAAAHEGAQLGLQGNGLMGQISLQALLDQSTAPPGFYTGGSRELPALQDLDRAKSTSYQVLRPDSYTHAP